MKIVPVPATAVGMTFDDQQSGHTASAGGARSAVVAAVQQQPVLQPAPEVGCAVAVDLPVGEHDDELVIGDLRRHGSSILHPFGGRVGYELA